MNLTSHFTVDEFKCPCCGTCNMDQNFMKLLEDFRVTWNRPLKINSGYRCAKHNKDVDGVPGSQHLQGKAADVEVFAPDRYYFVRLAFEKGFKGIGIGKNFVHMDFRVEDPKMWKY